MKLSLVKNTKGWATHIDGQLFVLDHRTNMAGWKARALSSGQLELVEKDYMIVSRLGTHPSGWIVAPVDDQKYVHVPHGGFFTEDGRTIIARNSTFNISPGRLKDDIRVADNSDPKVEYVWPVDGYCWVAREEVYTVSKLEPQIARVKLVGVLDLTDLVFEKPERRLREVFEQGSIEQGSNEHGELQFYFSEGSNVCSECHAHYTNRGEGTACSHCRAEFDRECEIEWDDRQPLAVA